MTNQPFGQYSTRVAAGSQRVAQTWQMVSRQPSWVVRAAVITFLLVFAVPIVFLVIVAAIAAAAVFLVVAGVYMVFERLRGAVRGDGRSSNVRVIQRRP